MKEVKISYRLLGFFPLIFKRECPEGWSDISPKHLIAISHLYTEEITELQFLSKTFRIPLAIIKKLDAFQVFSLMQEFEFVSDFKARESLVIPKLCDGVPPSDKLADLTFGRFMFIDTYFNEYASNNNDIQSLNKFVATLYWPEKTVFNDELISKRAEKANKIDVLTKQAVAINYRLIKEWLVVVYPAIFSERTDVDQPNVKKESTWLKIFDIIVGDDIINSEKYAGMLLHNVLRYVSRKIKENAKGT